MIVVTRLDGKEAVINDDQVLMIEETPDTVLTFMNGHRLVVKERASELVDRAVLFRRRIHGGLQVVAKRED
jgi:flagellar protein FlbD